ncbi:MAG TPA: hypothetical protein VN578_02565 [Candidatus Binatia bacterium]|jgi:hypothetical protein|nr:hypothetical protein [Candidatus Binatia bacterium]
MSAEHTTISIDELCKVSRGRDGMFQAFLACSELRGDRLALRRDDFDRLQKEHLGGLLLGTAIHKAIAPAVAALDGVAGTNLADCGGCSERELKLNAATRKGRFKEVIKRAFGSPSV